MTVLAILPARYGSTRFPGKPLTPIAGRPMIEHVWERTRRAKGVDDVAVATDDDRIRVALHVHDHDVVVNVQGDEPLIEGFVIEAALEALLRDDEAAMSTVVHRAEPEAFDDPNRVKVVVDRAGFALYFSRAGIPFRRKHTGLVPLQHVGLYAYRKDFLLEFVKLARTPAEQAEELEQLRALENGYRIRAALVEGWTSVPVDVPEDVPIVEAALARVAKRDGS